MIINTRSPYIITINESGQLGSRIELFIWNGTATEPSTPTYTLTMDIASSEITTNQYNISSYLEEYIDNIKPIYTGNEDSNKMYVYFKAKRYKLGSTGTYTLLDTVEGVGVSGYTTYLDGLNFVSTSNVSVLNDNTKEIIYERAVANYPYINVLAKSDTISVSYSDMVGGNVNTLSIPTTSAYKMYRVPVTTSSGAYEFGNLVTINGVIFKIVSECGYKYKPVLCSFINRKGGWSFLTFLRNQLNTIDTKGSQYNLMPDALPYNVSRGQVRSFNINGNQSVRLNTGWMQENHSEVIQELMLSETILLDGKPAVLKTRSTDLKSYNNNKMINYEIEFMYSFDLINNVV